MIGKVSVRLDKQLLDQLMFLPFVMASTLTTMAHCDAVGRGDPINKAAFNQPATLDK